ncbi:geranylgeranyl transferase type-1 subunit beta [Cryptotrichosporon argae]
MTDAQPGQALRQATFKRNAHVNYFLRCLRMLPESAEGHDSNRITIAYFCLAGLDLLGALEDKTTDVQRRGWADWVWSLQAPQGGFRGSTYMTTANAETSPGHLPSTYTALLVLAILRAPLDRLDVTGLQRFVASCQAPDGSFSPLAGMVHDTGAFQNDARMSYCAAAISDMVRDVPVDGDRAVAFIHRARTWEGGYASRPGIIEAQGGTTYCSLAALSLFALPSPGTSSSSSVPLTPVERADTLRWLTQRQIGGFQGRPGKLEDVCYSFWCGGAISLLEPAAPPIDAAANTAFLLGSQHPVGGFGKAPADFPDPFHSYLALAALALAADPKARAAWELGEVDVRWNLRRETSGWLESELRRTRGQARGPCPPSALS